MTVSSERWLSLYQPGAEPLRTAIELDAFTGLRRGELIGLQWQDVDFESLLVHVRRSVVMMVEGTPKTEASAKDLPLDAALAESLLKLKLSSPYNRETDWVFASAQMNDNLFDKLKVLHVMCFFNRRKPFFCARNLDEQVGAVRARG